MRTVVGLIALLLVYTGACVVIAEPAVGHFFLTLGGLTLILVVFDCVVRPESPQKRMRR